ncbi:MAG: hypothetical protein AAF598_19610, partial [Bacteroidota bacterium]
MKINKLNYEAYALDYLEGQLSGETLKEMEQFLEKHPEIQQELEAMVFIPLEPDTNIVFKNKNDLIKTPLAPVVDVTNPSNPSNTKIRPIFWIGLVAAVLLGSLLIFKFLATTPDTGLAPVVIEEVELPAQEDAPLQMPEPEFLPEQDLQIAKDSPATQLPMEPKIDIPETPTPQPKVERPSDPDAPLFAQEENLEAPERVVVENTPNQPKQQLEELSVPEAPKASPEVAPVEEWVAQEDPQDILEQEETLIIEAPTETIAEAEPTETPVWQIEQSEAIAMHLESDEMDDPVFESITPNSNRKKKKLFPKLREKLSKE